MRKKKFIFIITLTWSHIVFHSYKILLLNKLSNISVHYLTVSWAIFNFRMHRLFCLKSSNSFTGFTLKALSREEGQQYTSTFFDKITHLASLQCSTHCNRVVIKASETALLKNHQWLWITQSWHILAFYAIGSLSLLTVCWFWEISFSLISSYLPVHSISTSCVGPSLPAPYVGASLRDLPHGIPGQALPGSKLQLSNPEPAPTPSFYVETYVCIFFLDTSLCMSAGEITLLASSMPAWAICTFFWVPYLNYWHNYLANSPSQKRGSHCQYSPLLSFPSPTPVNSVSLTAL